MSACACRCPSLLLALALPPLLLPFMVLFPPQYLRHLLPLSLVLPHPVLLPLVVQAQLRLTLRLPQLRALLPLPLLVAPILLHLLLDLRLPCHIPQAQVMCEALAAKQPRGAKANLLNSRARTFRSVSSPRDSRVVSKSLPARCLAHP